MSKKILNYFLIPSGFYLTLFIILTFPLILYFPTDFFGDNKDGLMSVWNVWWVNKAIVELGQFPLYTNYVYYPYGVGLWNHSLTLFNGLLSLPFFPLLGLVKTFNILIIFEFIFAGLTAFWLCKTLTKSYFPSLIGGSIFTFSSYHFAHLQGHLDIISIGLIPLFILTWYKFLEKPNFVLAFLSSLILTLNIFCAYYYFLYCIGAGFIILVWFKSHKYPIRYFYLASFVIFSLLFISPFLYYFIPLALGNISFLPKHDPLPHSLDLLSIIIPGKHWFFSDLTSGFWQSLSGSQNEKSVSVGISVIFLTVYLYIKNHQLKIRNLKLWYLIALIFFVLSLGTVLQINSYISGIYLPYALLHNYFPFFKDLGVPIRMIVMVTLALSIISAYSLKLLILRKNKILVIFILIWLIIDHLPSSPPHTNLQIPDYVYFLKNLPEDGILDASTNPVKANYYQTIHNKRLTVNPLNPLEFPISRVPQDVISKNRELSLAFFSNRFDILYQHYHIHYLVIPNGYSIKEAGLKKIYNKEDKTVYELTGH